LGARPTMRWIRVADHRQIAVGGVPDVSGQLGAPIAESDEGHSQAAHDSSPPAPPKGLAAAVRLTALSVPYALDRKRSQRSARPPCAAAQKVPPPQPTPLSAIGQQQTLGVADLLLAKPCRLRRSESRLVTIADVLRKRALHCFAEEPLGLSTLELHIGGDRHR